MTTAPTLLHRASHNLHLPGAFLASLWPSLRGGSEFDRVETYCMFIGYPRSGHSLVGSLLDAHPDAVIAHELDALRYFRAGFRRNQVYALIVDNDRRFSAGGRRAKVDYTYAVPNQWQGRYRRLAVIGDKKGGRSTRALSTHPHLLDRLRSRVGKPLRVIHVVRNPYDNISTIFTRSPKADLRASIDHYLSLCNGVADIRNRLGTEEHLDVHLESLLEEPAVRLGELCRFLGLETPDDYVRDCSGILLPEPRRTRDRAPWTPELVELVEAKAASFEHLRRYSFWS